ncbi:hypothetical protein, partial [Streptomyces sp. NPDC005486]|uniref:hypothetical protein n=1 Tax=Streptomyces sp. NPDC005486 TaxID=3155345 RepID=UPI0033A59FE5
EVSTTEMTYKLTNVLSSRQSGGRSANYVGGQGDSSNGAAALRTAMGRMPFTSTLKGGALGKCSVAQDAAQLAHRVLGQRALVDGDFENELHAAPLSFRSSAVKCFHRFIEILVGT